MAVRGFIVAIENYSQIENLPPNLPGTHDSAIEFRDWLIDTKAVDSGDIYLCMDGTHAAKTHGATRTQIKTAIIDLASHADQTEELYLFFSGHGFTYTEAGNRTADVFVCEEFTNSAVGGDACIILEEVQRKLRAAMGHGKHFYFVDACRNMISDRDIEVSDTGLVLKPADSGIAMVYTLFSTARGALTNVTSGFATHLIAGLKGQGRAKTWRSGGLAVVYRSLYDYIARCMTDTEIGGQGDAPEGLILQMLPPFERFSAATTERTL